MNKEMINIVILLESNFSKVHVSNLKLILLQ